MTSIRFEDLVPWLEQYCSNPKEVSEEIAYLWERFHMFPKQCKAAIDEISHPSLISSSDPDTMKCKEKLEAMIDKFGEFSIVYQSIVKMIIDCELDAKDIKKEVKRVGVLPAAFVPSLVAKPELTAWHIVSFVNNVFDKEYSKDPIYYDRYRNVLNLRKRLRRKMRSFFKRLGSNRRLIKLSNGSSTRLQDGVNLQDINGSVYMTDEEEKLIEKMKPLLDWLHIDNFSDDFLFLETTQIENTFGSVNYAPDDSGKTRISFCIDPCVQVVSKAFHELLDYMVKDLACNGTYRQQSVIRNMIKKGRHKKIGVIISTDMSKYSDTMIRKRMLEVLEWIGIPKEVLECLDLLFSLPLWDSVLKTSTGSTDATYQGQYGDFPWITLMNIFNQLISYDYVNFMYGYDYSIELDLRKAKFGMVCRNDMNCAVGDDTIMAFPNWQKSPEELFWIIKAVFNRVGVNINLSKTHWIHNGEGCCDFIKRLITCDGLIPYLRIQAIVSKSIDERCEELLRFYRDNLIDYSNWCNLVDLFLEEPYRTSLKNLHVLNGGIVTGIITEEDVKLFCIKNRVYSDHYQKRNKDEIRKWIDRLHNSYQVNLTETHLISFLIQEISPSQNLVAGEDNSDGEVLWDAEDEDLDLLLDSSDNISVKELKEISDFHSLKDATKSQFSSWSEVQNCFSEQNLEDVLLNSYVRGYEHPDLHEVSRLIGLTLEQALFHHPDFREFFLDYQQGEIYRYLYSNASRVLNVYTKMFTEDWSWIIREDSIYRFKLDQVKDREGKSIYDLFVRKVKDKTNFDITDKWVYGTNYSYLEIGNKYKYRLYDAIHSEFDFVPEEVFYIVLGYDVSRMSSTNRIKAYRLYLSFQEYLGV